MNDLEDYTHVFFQECDDLLGDLEDLLAALSNDTAEDETIHAAFRAVHSIKGGADAFGYKELVSFAHAYEAAMDAIRSDRLALAPEVCEALIKARDVLCDLVERAKAGDNDPFPPAALMAEDLTALVGGECAAPSGEALRAASDPDPEPESALDQEDTDFDVERFYTIRFAPGPEFHRSGHDALRVFQALKDLGALNVTAEGEVPPLDAFEPDSCPLSWTLELATEADQAKVEAFFEIYQTTATVAIEVEASEEDAPPPEVEPPAASPPEKATAPKDAVSKEATPKEKPAQVKALGSLI